MDSHHKEQLLLGFHVKIDYDVHTHNITGGQIIDFTVYFNAMPRTQHSAPACKCRPTLEIGEQ